MGKIVRVEIGETGLPIRIFRTKEWRNLPEDKVQKMDRGKAVSLIRIQVFDRAYNLELEIYECERCGRTITEETGQMHETIFKGKGGEVSLENCEALCRLCHQTGPDAAHKGRRWQTSKVQKDQNE
jgi:5-methylcytosine-specific restriction endonuclease McrA